VGDKFAGEGDAFTGEGDEVPSEGDNVAGEGDEVTYFYTFDMKMEIVSSEGEVTTIVTMIMMPMFMA
jgi:hypothetical protein